MPRHQGMRQRHHGHARHARHGHEVTQQEAPPSPAAHAHVPDPAPTSPRPSLGTHPLAHRQQQGKQLPGRSPPPLRLHQLPLDAPRKRRPLQRTPPHPRRPLPPSFTKRPSATSPPTPLATTTTSRSAPTSSPPPARNSRSTTPPRPSLHLRQHPHRRSLLHPLPPALSPTLLVTLTLRARTYT